MVESVIPSDFFRLQGLHVRQTLEDDASSPVST
jgi:hypothetical protein